MADLKPEPVLGAPDPVAWLARHLPAPPNEPGLRLDEVLAAGNGTLAESHRRMGERGIPAPAAASYLAEWFPGGVARIVGFGLAAGAAGFIVDPVELRWHLAAEGWPEQVVLGDVETVVADGHPWAGVPGVTVVDTPGEVLTRAVGALVAASAPLIDACHGLARIGRVGLWNEVGDELGLALLDREELTVTPDLLAVLDAAVRVPGVPWRTRPSLRFAESALGPVHVAQKGGCCLAYTRTEPDGAEDGEIAGEAHRRYLERYPLDREVPSYCSTCSLRDPADCDARQVAWRELVHEYGDA